MGNHANHFRNDFSRFAQFHRISNPDVFFRNVVLIMQGSPADGRAGNTDWLKIADWSQHACTADIHFNIQQLGFFFFRRIFKCFRPFGKFGRAAKRTALDKIIDFYNGTIRRIP